jgi:dephospho-CoA kinase
LGAHIVDADRIAHQITAPGGRAIAAIVAHFGADYIDADGALARGRMRERVFADPVAKAALEQILHPMIRAETEACAAAAADDAAYVVLVIPLLIESGSWRERVDRVLVIDCAEQMQVDRAMRRSGLAESAARAIVASQASRAARLQAADDVLVNQDSVAAALARTARLHALYARLAQAHRSSPIDADSRML